MVWNKLNFVYKNIKKLKMLKMSQCIFKFQVDTRKLHNTATT